MHSLYWLVNQNIPNCDAGFSVKPVALTLIGEVWTFAFRLAGCVCKAEEGEEESDRTPFLNAEHMLSLPAAAESHQTCWPHRV